MQALNQSGWGRSPETISYRGHVEIFGGPLIRGWCARRDGEPGGVSIFVDGQFKAQVVAANYRKDLDQRNFCKTGGGFEFDISGFLTPFAVSHVQLKDPAGVTLASGEFDVDYRTVIRGEFDHLYYADAGTVGLYGNPYAAGDVSTGTVMSKILYALEVTKRDSTPGVCSIWHHHPHHAKPDDVPRLINRAFTDISKSGIDKAHDAVFGRALCVQPEAIEAETAYVVKSEANATHDGRVVAGRDIAGLDLTGKVVQHVIDNTVGELFVRDIRVPIVGGAIPFVYIKRRPIGTRFSNANTQASVTATGNVLDEAEQADILRFCRLIGFDYGELDVLRDNRDHQIWVVDANNTPAGPPNGLTRMETVFAIRELALAFQREFLIPGIFFSESREPAPNGRAKRLQS